MLQVLRGVLDLHLACGLRDLRCKLLDEARVLLELLHPLAEVKLIELDAALDTFN
jgi:hypothetical protein